MPKIIPIVIHNAGYDTHFIINLLAEEFKSGFICVGENIAKYITLLVLIKNKM